MNFRAFVTILSLALFDCPVSGADAVPAITGELQVDRQLFFTTSRVEAYLVPGGRGETGTGFFVEETYEGNISRFFLITCAHVIYGMTGLKLTFVETDSNGGPDTQRKFTLKSTTYPRGHFYTRIRPSTWRLFR